MKTLIRFTNFSCVLLASCSFAGAAVTELFVSPTGNDANTGGQASPFEIGRAHV